MEEGSYLFRLPDELLKRILQVLCPPTIPVRFIRIEVPTTHTWTLGFRPLNPSTKLIQYLSLASQNEQFHRCAWEVLAEQTSLHFIADIDVIPPTVSPDPTLDADLTYLLANIRRIFVSDIIGLRIGVSHTASIERYQRIHVAVERSRDGSVSVTDTHDIMDSFAMGQAVPGPQGILERWVELLGFRIWDFEQRFEGMAGGEMGVTVEAVYRLVDLPDYVLGTVWWNGKSSDLLPRRRTHEVREEEGRRRAARV